MLYDLTMPSLTAKRIKGKIYYYLRECQRVDGKPKIVWQQYLGSAQQLVQRMVPPQPQSALIRDYGAVVAPLGIAQQLDLVSIIDRHVPKRGRGPSVGQYLLVACLNRCVAPRSKAQIAEWYEKTVLPARLGLKASQLTSQRFWDNMDRLDADAIARIEQEISAGAVARFGLDLRCLLFDATNFFTFVDSFNARATLPQRGHSKEGRDNLRLLGLALLVLLVTMNSADAQRRRLPSRTEPIPDTESGARAGSAEPANPSMMIYGPPVAPLGAPPTPPIPESVLKPEAPAAPVAAPAPAPAPASTGASAAGWRTTCHGC